MDFISRSALQERFASECIGECSCCTHNYEGLDGMGYCGLINEAPGVDVVSRTQYDDLYQKYCSIAQILNDKIHQIMKSLENMR